MPPLRRKAFPQIATRVARARLVAPPSHGAMCRLPPSLSDSPSLGPAAHGTSILANDAPDRSIYRDRDGERAAQPRAWLLPRLDGGSPNRIERCHRCLLRRIYPARLFELSGRRRFVEPYLHTGLLQIRRGW